MPRRIPDYPDAYAGWNAISSYGSYVSAFGVLVFLLVLWRTFTAGARVAENPWGAGATTLEWTLPSPPAFHSYEEIPVITGGGGH
jgi:cytochrome c oxidase subunit 1